MATGGRNLSMEVVVKRRRVGWLCLVVGLWLACGWQGPRAVAQGTPAAGCSAGQVGIGDPYFPTMGNGGYDVEHYDLDLDIDVPTGEINAATVTIEATALVGLCAFNFDFEGLTIDGIAVDGTEAEFARNGKELTVTPDEPLDAGDAFTTVVRYHGTPVTPNFLGGASGSGPETPDADEASHGLGGSDPDESLVIQGGWFAGNDEVFVLGEPTGSRFWYPVNEHPADKATYTASYTVADPFVVVANGSPVAETDNGSTTTFVWDSRDPIASYLVTFHAGRLETENLVGPHGLPIRLAFAPSVPEAQRAVFRKLPEMIEYAETVFGPYPFESAGATVVGPVFGLALETQTLPIYGAMGSGETESLSQGALVGLEVTIFHELAHQWFGDSVSVANWRDIWLNEGFATYAEALWLEHTFGPDERDLMLESIYHGLPGKASVPTADPTQTELFSSASVYGRGAMTLHALRLTVGDEAFFAILQAWTARYHDANASTADFIATAEDVSGEDLGELFDTWLFDTRLPELP